MSLRDDAALELAALEAKGRLRGKRVLQGTPGPVLALDDHAARDFSSNDYLGLAADERLQQAAIRGMQLAGMGATASRLILTHEVHEQLEAALAAWLAVERVQLFNSGYVANVGVLSTIAGPEDVVFSDELNHASIIDGCRLSRAKVVVYRHLDLDELELGLRSVAARRKIVVSESLFSMDGDLADVAALHGVTQRCDATLVLDEAHALGVYGPQGRGIAAQVGIVPDVLIGTLGKAFGCFGAFAATSETVATLLWNRARPLVFSTGLPPLVTAAAAAALEILRGAEGDARRAAVAYNARTLRAALNLPGQSHIVPWVLGADSQAVAASRQLLDQGLFVQAIRPPTVPEGTARLRIALGNQDDCAVRTLAAALLTLPRS